MEIGLKWHPLCNFVAAVVMNMLSSKNLFIALRAARQLGQEFVGSTQLPFVPKENNLPSNVLCANMPKIYFTGVELRSVHELLWPRRKPARYVRLLTDRTLLRDQSYAATLMMPFRPRMGHSRLSISSSFATVTVWENKYEPKCLTAI